MGRRPQTAWRNRQNWGNRRRKRLSHCEGSCKAECSRLSSRRCLRSCRSRTGSCGCPNRLQLEFSSRRGLTGLFLLECERAVRERARQLLLTYKLLPDPLDSNARGPTRRRHQIDWRTFSLQAGRGLGVLGEQNRRVELKVVRGQKSIPCSIRVRMGSSLSVL